MSEEGVLWVTVETKLAILADRRHYALYGLSRTARLEAKRAKRRAQKAHSRACRLTWMCERAKERAAR